MRLDLRTIRPAAVLAAVLLAGTALADGLQRLPPDFRLPPSEGSPGQVTFSHQSHVDTKAPGCTACHPRLFRILEKGLTSDAAPIRHAAMEQGRQCGACHGKTAFGFDSCDLCHR